MIGKSKNRVEELKKYVRYMQKCIDVSIQDKNKDRVSMAVTLAFIEIAKTLIYILNYVPMEDAIKMVNEEIQEEFREEKNE